MARDEALLLSAARSGEPTLRLYAWSPPCLSLGAHQSSADVDVPACRARGVDLVRRPTGGGAVLHDAELTYAVAGRLGEGVFPASVVGVHDRIAAALVAGLARLGIQAEANSAGRRGRSPADCFGVASSREIVVRGRKLIGSAQVRRRASFLQHGSLLLDLDPERLAAVLPRGERPLAGPPGGHAATTLRAERGAFAERLEVERAIAAGFRDALGVALVPGEADAREHEDTEALRARKYLDARWTLEGSLRMEWADGARIPG